MDIPRKLAILVFFMVPAIIGGGVIYHFAHSYAPVVVYEVILYLFAGAYATR